MLKAGDKVRLTNPESEGEKTAVYVVVEMRGTRVLIQLVCNLPIPPMECVALSEVTPIND